MSVSSTSTARPSDAAPDEVLRLLLLETANGSAAAFAELYDRLAPVVHGFVGSTGMDVPGAESTTEAVFAGVWRRAARFEPSGLEPMDWLLGMTVGTIVLRRARRLRRDEFNRRRADRADRR